MAPVRNASRQLGLCSAAPLAMAAAKASVDIAKAIATMESAFMASAESRVATPRRAGGDASPTQQSAWMRAGARFVVALLIVASTAMAVVAAPAATFSNPIVEAAPDTGSADPSVVLFRGYYYYCRALGDRAIGVARARRLQDIGAAPMVTVFRPGPDTDHGRELWAPELQRIRGRWYIYFAASDGVNAHHRMYALQAESDDPQGRYVLKGRVSDDSDRWAIDGVALELHGKLYFVWSGWPEATGDFPQVLYIAAMRDPWTIAGRRHLIAAPEHAWERAVAAVLEGPEPIVHRGRMHLVYSAGASWSDDYSLGLLEYRGGDPLHASSWRKQPLPVFAKNPAARAFGVGHASFVRSPDGKEDWIVYHATDRPGAGWRARSVRAQPFQLVARWQARVRPAGRDRPSARGAVRDPGRLGRDSASRLARSDRWRASAQAATKHQQQVVGRHVDASLERQAGALRFGDDLGEAAQAPGRISLAQIGVESGVARRRRLAVDEIGAVQHDRAAGHEMSRRASHQRSAGGPFGDVQQVRAVEGVEATERLGPAWRANVQRQRRPDVAERSRARSDRCQRARVGVGRLPVPVGARGGEMLGVLPASARDLEHRRRTGQETRSAPRGSVPCCGRRPG